MNFIIDENLPRRVAVWLAAAGHEAHHVSDLGLQGCSDESIWEEAVRRDAFVVTRDSDFVILAGKGARGGVVRLLIGNCPTDVLLARLGALWPEVEERIIRGDRLIEVG